MFCSFSYHYIIQINSKPIPALKVVIQQLRKQQTSVTYLASVLANHRLLHYDIKTKKEQFWLHLSCQDGSSHLAPLLCDRSGNLGHLVAQLGNPVKAERLMHFGGSFVHFRGMDFEVRTLNFGTRLLCSAGEPCWLLLLAIANSLRKPKTP